ncbi:HNH endonuclease family protein [Klebsiella sp. K794]|uniref:HNH endonuclease family protein n=1 Tax=Klebsiella sp. K794 TaxID=3369402 RepID=UPI003C2B59AB
MGEISVKTGNNARNGGKNSLNRLIRCVCGKKIGPDPRNFNQRVSLGRNDLLIRTFLRYHYNSQRKMVTKNNLFSSMRKILTKPEEAYQYLKSLIDYSPIYASLINPNDAWWGDQDEKYRNVLHYLNGIRLFNIKQPLTIFLAAFGNFSPEEFVKLVRYLYVLSIRYNVICHLSPSEQENIYNQIANKVYNREFLRASHVKNSEEFKRLYPDDNSFFNAFEFHRMPSRQTAKKIRFLLSEIEGHLGNQCDYEKTTLEHICPYHPEKEWCDSFGEGINDVKDRLGNMILMDKDNLKRSSFEDKKKEYTKSGYFLASKVTEYAEWNLETVNDFQKWMSKQAVNVWKVD